MSSKDDRLGGDNDPFVKFLTTVEDVDDDTVVVIGLLVVMDNGTVDRPAAFKDSGDIVPI